MSKGKWAQGIPPRDFKWVIKDRLALSEKLGGFGEQHRRVRRQEEVIWVRERRFRYVISLMPDDDLSSYEDLGMRWKHWPLSTHLDIETVLTPIYPELQRLIRTDSPILIHMDDVNDRLAGFVSGYLVYTGMVPDVAEAVQLTEKLMGKALGPGGREMTAAAARIADAEGSREADGARTATGTQGS